MPTSVPDEPPSEGTFPGGVDDVFAYVRPLVGSVEPAIVFSSLIALCVPGFSDSCSADIIEGGRVRYRIAAPHRAEDLARDPLTDPDGTSRAPFEIRTTFESALEGWASYAGVMVHRWRNYEPTADDEVRAGRIVKHAMRVIRDERLADPMQVDVASSAATFRPPRRRS